MNRRADNILNSQGYQERLQKYKWKQIVSGYKTEQEVVDLYKSRTLRELSELWGCSVDCVKTIRDKLNLEKKNISQDYLIKRYTRSQLEDMYVNKFDRNLGRMAKYLGAYSDTLSKVFKRLAIKQNPHHPSEYDEVRKELSRKAKERAKGHSPISNILSDPNWRKKADASRILSGSAKQPHKENRGINTIPKELLISEVLHRGVMGAARLFELSQSTIRDWCRRNNIALISGPREYLTTKKEYRVRARKQAIDAFTHKPKFTNTSIEVAMQGALSELGIEFETQKPLIDLTVPDIFVKPNIAIYCDGDYWHNLKAAKSRDAYVNEGLRRANYKVFRFWEHEIQDDLMKCAKVVHNYIQGLKLNDERQ